MENLRMTICLMATVVVMAAGQVLGVTEFNDGGTHNINYTINDDVWVDYQATSTQTTVNLVLGGKIPYPYILHGYNDSKINILGSNVRDLYVSNNSQVTISSGSVSAYLYAAENSQVTMSGGSINQLIASNNSQITISGGVAGGNLVAWDNSLITISGGSASDTLKAFNEGQINMSGGTVFYGLEASQTGRITMSGGSVNYLSVSHSSQATMSGGTVRDKLRASDSSQITMSGGTIGLEIQVTINAVLIIKGFDFAIDGGPFGFGEITSLLGGDYNNEPVRHLTGTLLSGELLNNYFRIGNNAKIVLAPEPTPPIANADGPYTIYVGDTLTLDASGSTDDDDNIVSYLWDLDDNNSFETDAGSDAVFDVNYAYLQSLGLLVGNTYKIHLKVTDGGGLSNVANSTLTIIPTPALLVLVDIKPGSCPNPLNVKSSGVLPAAILGTADFDVSTIDATSIRLAGVSPLRSSIEDVGRPAIESNDCNCTEDGPDGFHDLTLKFKTRDIVEAIGDVNYGDTVTLKLTGVLIGENPIEGADCVVIGGKSKPFNKADINKDGVVDAADFAEFAKNWLQSSIVEE